MIHETRYIPSSKQSKSLATVGLRPDEHAPKYILMVKMFQIKIGILLH